MTQVLLLILLMVLAWALLKLQQTSTQPNQAVIDESKASTHRAK